MLVAMSGTLDLAPASLGNGAMRFVSKTGQPEDLLGRASRRSLGAAGHLPSVTDGAGIV